MSDIKDTIEGEVLGVVKMQRGLEAMEAELAKDKKFQQFLQLRKQVDNKWKELRETVKPLAIEAYKKGSIDKTTKGEWGSLTITETDTFDIDEKALPANYWKKVVNTTVIRERYQLEHFLPKGVEYRGKTYNISLRVKEEKE